MPIARFELRNEYGLGQPELYKDVDREDPKAVLDGVSVARLVGILRQLGDLSEFAAEIFHGIQEEVMTTACRSNILMNRLHHIEAVVPPLGKTMLSQTSHIHFAYTEGHKWHGGIPKTQNHFICNDLPRVIMNPYEECRDPPRLHFLDKFDIDGPGSCLKRYSDPTFFRRASGKPVELNSDFRKDDKNRKLKKKKPLQRNRDLSHVASVAMQSGRKPFTSLSFGGRSSSSKTVSTIDTERKSDLQDHTRSFDSRNGSGYIEQHLSTATSSLKAEEKPPGEFSSSSLKPGALTIASVLIEGHSEDADDNFSDSPLLEKVEIAESNGLQPSMDDAPEIMKTTYEGKTGGADFCSDDIEAVESVSSLKQYAEIEAEEDIKAGRRIEREHGLGMERKRDSEQETESEGDTFVDALNTIESESDADFPTEQKNSSDITDERLETSKGEHEFAWACPTEQEREQNLDNGKLGNEVEGHSHGNDQTSSTASDLQESKIISSGTETVSSANASDELIARDSRVALDSAGRDVYNGSKGDYDIKSPSFSASGENISSSSNPFCNNVMQEHQESEAEACSNVRPITIWTNGNLLGLKPSKPPVFGVPKAEEPEKEQSDIVVRNGFGREGSFNRDRRIVPETIPEIAEVAEKSEVETFKEPFRDDSPFGWFTSSPPLEHMKISFNPTESLQISKLKLKFPDGVRLHEGNEYTFSSFQLVPEPTTSVLDFDSDYDTFSRSSPHMSDYDYPTDDDSLSSSKQWEQESGDSSERKDQEIYDSLYRNTHAKPDGEHDSLSPPLLNIPSFETLNPSLQFETANGSVQNSAEPLPPPLPPIQWRASKPLTERSELKLVFDEKGHASTGSQLSRTDPFYKEKPGTVSVVPKPENNVHQKNNGREDEQNGNVKETEAEDFLHQIRTKQFNLRSVVTTRPSSSAAARTGSVLNINITAILEKANSIRQAVASEDEDGSDTWSDA